MKVLIIPTWYPIGTDKLMGIYHKEFASSLVNKVNVDILYIDRQKLSKPLSYLFMKKRFIINEDGYKTYVARILDLKKISFDLQMKHYTNSLYKAFKKYVKINGKPDIIHAHVSIPAGYSATYIGNKYNIPVVVTEHASYYERFFEEPNAKYGKYVLENSYFTTVSNYMCNDILKRNYRCSVLPNLVDIDEFILNRKKIPELKLITVSSLRKQKRIDDIIASLKIIRKKYSTATLTIVGDGFDEKYYKEKCQELNMNDYVSFVGRKTKKEIANILINHNVFVSASEKETFCIPLIEALASGMPVVSTKSLGPEEFIDNKCGKLVDVGDIKSLANAIIDIYNNIDSYDINYLRKKASIYSSKNIANKAITIYNNLLQHKI